MDSNRKSAGSKSLPIKYIALVAVVLLVIIGYTFLSPSPSKHTSQTTTASKYSTSQFTTVAIPNYTVTPSAQSGIYCVGGVNKTAFTNTTYFASSPSPNGLNWQTSTPYPYGLAASSCVYSNNTIYCTGGDEEFGKSLTITNLTYYSALSNGNIDWLQSHSYPIPVQGNSCVASNGYIYCIGGATDMLGSSIASTYYAQLTNSGVGQWQSSTPYPTPIHASSCVSYNNYMYCMGGILNGNETSSVYFAPLSASGIGKWSSTLQYPIPVSSQSCVQYSGYVYCVGNNPNFGLSNASFFAQPSNSGINMWFNTTAYPMNLVAPSQCISDGNEVYCIGSYDGVSWLDGSIVSATLSKSGINEWSKAGRYPMPIEGQSCIAAQ